MNKQRSRAYPSLDLKVAVSKIESIARNLGQGSFERSDIVLGMGYKGITGTSGRATAALVQYGLLDRRKDKYTLSELGRAIAYPLSDDQKRKAIREAALRPAIFSDLYGQYKMQGLPETKFLANMLATPSYGINPAQKDEVALTFVNTLQFAGLLDGRRIIDGSAAEDEETNDNASDIQEAEIAPSTQMQAVSARPVTAAPVLGDDLNLNKIEIVLREGIKAGIYAPHDLTEAEKNRLKAIIDLL